MSTKTRTVWDLTRRIISPLQNDVQGSGQESTDIVPWGTLLEKDIQVVVLYLTFSPLTFSGVLLQERQVHRNTTVLLTPLFASSCCYLMMPESFIGPFFVPSAQSAHGAHLISMTSQKDGDCDTGRGSCAAALIGGTNARAEAMGGQLSNGR